MHLWHLYLLLLHFQVRFFFLQQELKPRWFLLSYTHVAQYCYSWQKTETGTIWRETFVLESWHMNMEHRHGTNKYRLLWWNEPLLSFRSHLTFTDSFSWINDGQWKTFACRASSIHALISWVECNKSQWLQSRLLGFEHVIHKRSKTF